MSLSVCPAAKPAENSQASMPFLPLHTHHLPQLNQPAGSPKGHWPCPWCPACPWSHSLAPPWGEGAQGSSRLGKGRWRVPECLNMHPPNAPGMSPVGRAGSEGCLCTQCCSLLPLTRGTAGQERCQHIPAPPAITHTWLLPCSEDPATTALSAGQHQGSSIIIPSHRLQHHHPIPSHPTTSIPVKHRGPWRCTMKGVSKKQQPGGIPAPETKIREEREGRACYGPGDGVAMGKVGPRA